ncbi:MAG: family 10 glycosylhydrolase [bacterium]|nr:family 10 glycosylhydrolase [bacterium]
MAKHPEEQRIVLGSLKPRDTRRLIYNSDPSNTTSHLSDPAAQPKELRQIVRNYAQEGGIDTLVQEVFAEAMTMFWRTDKCPYDIRYQHQRMVPMMDNGVMPVEVYIDECHKQGMEFIAGFRMNDRHGHHPEFFKKLCEEKPEWVLREYKPSWRGAPPESHEFGCSVNYAIPEVREWLLSIMEEVATRFDIDGIEFNFTRLAECFPKGETEQSHGIMTDFIRQVREMLDKASEKSFSPMTLDHHGFKPHEKRERKLILGVRVPQQLKGCQKMGFDIPTWIQEGLIDYVAPSDFGFTDFNEQYEDFASLARAHNCYVYPQVQPRLWIETTMEMDLANYRAAVQNFYAAGADGFSTQNFFFHWGPKFEIPGDDGPKIPNMYPAALNNLKELKSPESIANSGDRHYIFLPLWADRQQGRGMSEIYVKEEIVLSRQQIGPRGEFRFRISENFPEDPILPLTDEGSGLTFMLLGSLKDDELTVDINGKTIPAEHSRWKWYDDDQPPSCTIALSSPPFVYGDNYLGVKITKAIGEGEIKIERVECMVRAENQ